MKTAIYFGMGLAVAALLTLAAGGQAYAAEAQAAAAVAKAPVTLWNFLGIPQGVNKIRDATVNPKGNHPKLERKPPMKRIADPENLESPNDAIKVAAKIKADADLAPQKIKAIKYLATVCCGCAKNKEDLKDALLGALEDCTEEVRYQAAIALCHCSGNLCAACNYTSCCDPKVVAKLKKVAEGQDAHGCWIEPSPRVRAAAANALAACEQVAPPAEPKKPDGGEAPSPEPTPAPAKDGKAAPKAAEPSASSADGGDGVTSAGFVQIDDGGLDRRTTQGLVVPASATQREVRFQGRILATGGRAR